MLGELRAGREEVAIAPDVERDSRSRRRPTQRLLHPPLPRLDDHELLRAPASLREPAEAGGERRGECGRLAGPRGRGEFGVIDANPFSHQHVAEMPHAREKDGDPCLVRPDVGALLGHFGHPDPVPGAVEVVEGGTPSVELVTEHDHE